MPRFANRSSEELRAIYNLAPIGLGALDDRLRYIRVNEYLAEINGLPADEHPGKSLAEVVPTLAPELEPLLRRLVETGDAVADRVVQGETPGQPGVERTWRCKYVPLRDVNATIVGVNMVVEEITERDRLQRELTDQRNDYQALADSMPVIVISVDANRNVVFSNSRWKDQVGQGNGATNTTRIEDLAHPSDRTTIRALFDDTPGVGARSFCEARLRDRRGAHRWHLIEASHIDAPNRDDAHWYVTAADIEKQKRVEAKLRRRTEVLIAEDRRKDEFLAVLGHEIRNPIAAMESAVSILESGDEDPAWSLEVLRSQLSQISRLVNDLLDDARIRQGKIALDPKPVDVASLLAVSAESVRAAADQKRVDVELDLPDEPVTIVADRSRLEQVVSNLLTNAIRYSEHGGRVRIAAEAQGDDLELRVEDDGVGIPREMLATIFEPFVQLSSDSPDPSHGLGVGLSLVRQIVQLHGGQIRALSSGEGEGSVFVVRLPGAVRRGAAPDRLAASSADLPGLPTINKSVLLVDDNEAAMIGLKRLLEAVGCDVVTALTGKQGWQCFSESDFDAAVLDIGLPDISGHELARTFRKASDDSGRQLQLIALTGYGHERARVEARVAGFDHHLLKPADFGELLRLLSN